MIILLEVITRHSVEVVERFFFVIYIETETVRVDMPTEFQRGPEENLKEGPYLLGLPGIISIVFTWSFLEF